MQSEHWCEWLNRQAKTKHLKVKRNIRLDRTFQWNSSLIDDLPPHYAEKVHVAVMRGQKPITIQKGRHLHPLCQPSLSQISCTRGSVLPSDSQTEGFAVSFWIFFFCLLECKHFFVAVRSGSFVACLFSFVFVKETTNIWIVSRRGWTKSGAAWRSTDGEQTCLPKTTRHIDDGWWGRQTKCLGEPH